MIFQDINHSYTLFKTDNVKLKIKIANLLSVYEENYQHNSLYKANLYDGKVKFFKIDKNKNLLIYKGLIPYILKKFKNKNIQYTYIPLPDDDIKVTEEELQAFIKSLNLPFEPYKHQFRGILEAINKKRVTLRSATGSGKSFIAYVFLMYMYKHNKKSLLIVPSINLVHQMFTDFQDYGFKNTNDIKLIGGEFKKGDFQKHKIVISTWQSLYNMDSRTFEMFDVLLLDEAHTIKGDAISRIIKYATNCLYKIGMTGTIPRDKVSRVRLVGILGEIINIIKPQELIELGLATPIKINIFYLNMPEKDKDKLKGKITWDKEKKFVEEHYERNRTVSRILNKLSTKGNVLGLYTSTNHGEMLMCNLIKQRTSFDNVFLIYKITKKEIEKIYNTYNKDKKSKFFINLPFDEKNKKKLDKILSNYKEDFKNSIFSLFELNLFLMSGQVQGSVREYVRKKLDTIDASKENGAIILGNYKVVSTGVNYKRLDYIAYTIGTKSFYSIVQSIGRGMRLFPGKKKVEIIDFVDVTNQTKDNYFLKHFYERLEYYLEDGYPITEKEIKIKSCNELHNIKFNEW